MGFLVAEERQVGKSSRILRAMAVIRVILQLYKNSKNRIFPHGTLYFRQALAVSQCQSLNIMNLLIGWAHRLLKLFNSFFSLFTAKMQVKISKMTGGEAGI